VVDTDDHARGWPQRCRALGVIPAQAGIQYAAPLPYGAMADISTLTAYLIIRFRG
jgi:hypothetical protein